MELQIESFEFRSKLHDKLRKNTRITAYTVPVIVTCAQELKLLGLLYFWYQLPPVMQITIHCFLQVVFTYIFQLFHPVYLGHSPLKQTRGWTLGQSPRTMQEYIHLLTPGRLACLVSVLQLASISMRQCAPPCFTVVGTSSHLLEHELTDCSYISFNCSEMQRGVSLWVSFQGSI